MTGVMRAEALFGAVAEHRPRQGCSVSLVFVALPPASAVASAMTAKSSAATWSTAGRWPGITPGTPAEKVLSDLGTPSTTSTVGGDAWYYISQQVDRPLAFSPSGSDRPARRGGLFRPEKKVTRVANYGIEDGRVIDMVTRTTPTGGAEQGFLKNLFRSFLHSAEPRRFTPHWAGEACRSAGRSPRRSRRPTRSACGAERNEPGRERPGSLTA